MLLAWLKNLPTFHHRLMARYLERRGWVVFYLEGEHRRCASACWLRLYEDHRQ